MTSETMELLKRYAKKFDEGFPMYQAGRGLEERQIAEMVERCLREEKDAYQLGYAEESDDFEV